MPRSRQTNFSGGELAPGLWGRSDLAKWQQGLRRLYNFFVAKDGGAVSRPGTRHLGALKTSTAWRLLPFVYSDTQSYVLEFGQHYIRFWANSAQVLASYMNFTTQTVNLVAGETITGFTTGATAIVEAVESDAGATGSLRLKSVVGTFAVGETLTGSIAGDGVVGAPGVYQQPYELVTTYAATDLDKLQWAQSGDVLVLTHPDYPQKELTRLGNTNWTFSTISFTLLTGFTQAYLGLHRPPSGATDIVSAGLPTEDVANGMPAREWSYKATVILRDDVTDVVSETSAFTIVSYSASTTWPATGTGTLPGRLAAYKQMPITVWLPNEGIGSWAGHTIVSKRIYRGRGGLYGWIGDLEGSNTTFTDVGDEPDYALAPPAGTDPFDGYPTAVTYFQERRVFGGTPARPGVILASATGDYSNFDGKLIPLATSSLNYELASRRREDIRSIVGLDRLLIGTNSSIWSMAGSGGEPMTPDTRPDARVIEEIGMHHLPFLLVDGAALYTRAKGNGVRALAFDQNRDGFQGIDISTVSKHLMQGELRVEYELDGSITFEPLYTKQIVDWTYAEDPWALVWAVRDDGQLLSLTFDKQQEMWAWAQHETNGLVLNVCSVPEGEEDVVYLAVQRTVGAGGGGLLSLTGTAAYYMERFATRTRKGSPYDDAAVDCALRYEGDLFEAIYSWAFAFSYPTGQTSMVGADVTRVVAGATGTVLSEVMDVVAKQGHALDSDVMFLWRCDEAAVTDALVDIGPNATNLQEQNSPGVGTGQISGYRGFTADTGPGDAKYFYNAVTPLTAPVLAQMLGSMTIEAWVYRVNGGDHLFALYFRPPVSGTIVANNTLLQFNIRATTGLLQCLWEHDNNDSTGTSVIQAGGTAVPMATWTHVAVSLARAATTTVKFYVDGLLQDTQAGKTNPNDGQNSRIYVGNFGNFASGSGRVDDIRVSPRVRAAAEIYDSYKRGKGIGNTGTMVVTPATGTFANGDVFQNTGPTKSFTITSAPVATITPPSVEGLDHLEGNDVYLVAYGNEPRGPFTVEDGAIVLDPDDLPTTPFVDNSNQPVLVAHVGMLFTTELETLDVASAEARMAQKTVVSVGFEVDRRGGLQAGPDLDTLAPPENVVAADNYSGVETTPALVKVPIRGRWDDGGRAALKQTKPLPVTVVGLTRELEGGG